jgi:hypothetical protein
VAREGNIIMADLRKNFATMPWLLKLITLNAALGIVLIAATVAVPVNVNGLEVAPTEWWSSGAGPVTALAMALLFVSAYLMLKRSALARKLYLVSLGFAFATVPIVDHMVGNDMTFAAPDALSGPVFALVLMLVLGCYLHLNRDVQKYFERQS